MEIINRSKFDIIVSSYNNAFVIYCYNKFSPYSYTKFNIYLKIKQDLILIKKVTEFCNKIIIKDSLIENEVEVSCE